jgi:hypothetical protein
MADLADAVEALWYLFGFWAFVLSPKYRGHRMQAWRSASIGMRLVLSLEATVATAVGLGVPALLAWLIMQALLP